MNRSRASRDLRQWPSASKNRGMEWPQMLMGLKSEGAFLSLDCGQQLAQLERFLQGFHTWILSCDGFQMRGGNCRDDDNGQIRILHPHLLNDLHSINVSRKN